MAAVFNNLQSNYLTGFQNWSQLVMAAKIPNTDPPHSQVGYLAATASDGLDLRDPRRRPCHGYASDSAGTYGRSGRGGCYRQPHPYHELLGGLAAGFGTCELYMPPSPTTSQDGVMEFFTKVSSRSGAGGKRWG